MKVVPVVQRMLFTLAAVLFGVTLLSVPQQSAQAAGWTVTNRSVFGVGDSLTFQCGEGMGVGNRSVGIASWVGATTTDMRNRLTSTAPDWPFMTERTHADELRNFRSAGTLVIGLGTNDAALSSVAQYRTDVEWFMQQAAGRPVLWFNVYYPPFAAKAVEMNKVLADADARYPNLRLLDWHTMATATPSLIRSDDQVHIADYKKGCMDGRFKLIQDNLPAVVGEPYVNYAAPAGIPSPDPVATRYAQLGGARGPLGALVTPTICGMKLGTCKATYANGVVYSIPGRPTVAITNKSILTRYDQAWGETGMLGLPSGDTFCGLPGGGCGTHFESGAASIYWSPASGTRVVAQAIRNEWKATGWERGTLKYPVSEDICGLVRGGCGQHYQGGSIYVSPATGAHFIRGSVVPPRSWRTSYAASRLSAAVS